MPKDSDGAAVLPESSRRTTKQRLAVEGALEALDSFRSAQEIHDLLIHQDAGVSLTTVYRTLQAMESDGSVDSVLTSDGESLYRSCSAGHHHHLLCRKCGLTIEISAKTVEKWTEDIAQEHGFVQPDHTIEITGICADCQKA